jgi:hypothetical protein
MVTGSTSAMTVGALDQAATTLVLNRAGASATTAPPRRTFEPNLRFALRRIRDPDGGGERNAINDPAVASIVLDSACGARLASRGVSRGGLVEDLDIQTGCVCVCSGCGNCQEGLPLRLQRGGIARRAGSRVEAMDVDTDALGEFRSICCSSLVCGWWGA